VTPSRFRPRAGDKPAGAEPAVRVVFEPTGGERVDGPVGHEPVRGDGEDVHLPGLEGGAGLILVVGQVPVRGDGGPAKPLRADVLIGGRRASARR
jgi:hypothetical protein